MIASASEANHDYLREIGAIPVVYGEGMVDRVRAVDADKIDAVLDAAGKTPIEDLISLAPEPSQVVSIANFAAAASGARVTGGAADSQPMKALAEAAELLEQSKLVIKIQTFPFDRAAEAYQISQAGHGRGKLVLIPDSTCQRQWLPGNHRADKSASPWARSVWARQPSTRSAAEQSAVTCRTSPRRYSPVTTGAGPPRLRLNSAAIWPTVITHGVPMFSGVSPTGSRA